MKSIETIDYFQEYFCFFCCGLDQTLIFIDLKK
jgi:hypothetical protein